MNRKVHTYPWVARFLFSFMKGIYVQEIRATQGKGSAPNRVSYKIKTLVVVHNLRSQTGGRGLPNVSASK